MLARLVRHRTTTTSSRRGVVMTAHSFLPTDPSSSACVGGIGCCGCRWCAKIVKVSLEKNCQQLAGNVRAICLFCMPHATTKAVVYIVYISAAWLGREWLMSKLGVQ